MKAMIKRLLIASMIFSISLLWSATSIAAEVNSIDIIDYGLYKTTFAHWQQAPDTHRGEQLGTPPGGVLDADLLERLIFSSRPVIIGLFVVATAFMGYSASRIGIDAGFSKLLPLEHEYMKTYVEYRDAFGGANRVVIARNRSQTPASGDRAATRSSTSSGTPTCPSGSAASP